MPPPACTTSQRSGCHNPDPGIRPGVPLAPAREVGQFCSPGRRIDYTIEERRLGSVVLPSEWFWQQLWTTCRSIAQAGCKAAEDGRGFCFFQCRRGGRSAEPRS
jgi:hypothetical protein